MKLIVVGATGLIGTEVIRQALSHKSVTSVVALGRRPTPPPKSIPAGPSLEKFQSVTLDDFSHYPDNVKSQLTGADACIWYVVVAFPLSKTSGWFSPLTCALAGFWRLRRPNPR